MKGIYLRIGEWREVSSNFASGTSEVGISVYDLVEGKPTISEDATDSDFAAMDLAERTASDAPKYLVKGDYVGVGHDGEPLLRNLVKVAEVEICQECGGLEVKSVEGLHIRHVGAALYPVFRYPVPSEEHGLVALRTVAGMDLNSEVRTSSEMVGFATEVMAAYSKHKSEHLSQYERQLDVGQKLERRDGETWQEWLHRHQHGEMDGVELVEVERGNERHLDTMLLS